MSWLDKSYKLRAELLISFVSYKYKLYIIIKYSDMIEIYKQNIDFQSFSFQILYTI